MLFIFYLWTGLWTVSQLVTAKEITLVGVANPDGANSESEFGPVSVVVKTDSGSFERDNEARIKDFELPPAISGLIPPSSDVGKLNDVKSTILTPHQIQYFTNELLSLIGSKCKKVDEKKISQIQTYLSDVTNLDFSALKSFLPFLQSPSSGSDAAKGGETASKDNVGADLDAPLPSWFESLVNSLQTCAKSETPAENDAPLNPEDLTAGIDADILAESENEKETEQQEPEKEKEKDSKSSEEGAAFFEQESEQEPESGQEYPVHVKEQVSIVKETKVITTPKPVSKTIISHIDENEQEQHKKPKKNPIINWLHKAFTNVTSFFKQAFTRAKTSFKGLGDKLKRAKQSLLNHKDSGKSHEEEKENQQQQQSDPRFNLDLDSSFEHEQEQEEGVRTRRSRSHRLRRLAPPSLSDLDLADLLNGIFNPSGQKAAGRQMLKQILRDAFRIYGRSCPNLTPANIQAFRVTAKSFMNFVKQSEQLAFFITAVIDKNLVEAIRQCQKDNFGLKRK